MLLISSKLELHPLIQQPLGCLTLKTSLSYLPSLIYNLWLVLVIYQIQTSPDTQINNTFTRYHVTYSHSTHTHTHSHTDTNCPAVHPAGFLVHKLNKIDVPQWHHQHAARWVELGLGGVRWGGEGGWGGHETETQTKRRRRRRRRFHRHVDRKWGGVLTSLPCREMKELAREPRSLYPAFQRKTEERKKRNGKEK